jgi:transposase-like protein
VQRAKLVLYAAEGATNVEIAMRLGMNADVVGRWRKRFHDERLGGACAFFCVSGLLGVVGDSVSEVDA